jgi:hypothetical protein
MGRRRKGRRERNVKRGKGWEDGRDFEYSWNPFPNIDDDGQDGSRTEPDPGSSPSGDPDAYWDIDPADVTDETEDNEGALLRELIDDPLLLRRYRRL